MRNGRVEWKRRSTEDIFNLFEPQEWHKIFADITTREQFEDFLSSGVGECWVAYDKQKDKAIAFVHLHMAGRGDNVVVHGGSWTDNPSINYISLLCILDSIFSQGFGIRTSCLCENKKAYRFLHSVGFVKYRTADGYHYLWLDENRFRNTVVYNRFINIYNQH